MDKFLTEASFVKHMASDSHCRKYLSEQSHLGFDKFFSKYGNIPFGDMKIDLSSEMNNLELMVYRSGITNKLECRVIFFFPIIIFIFDSLITGSKCSEILLRFSQFLLLFS